MDKTNRKEHFGESETWIGLHPQILQTPYKDICTALTFLAQFSPSTIVDLGAGYGRVGLVSAMLLPGSKFVGLEIIKERCNEANRVFEHFGLTNCIVENKCLMDKLLEIPKADVFFIYDFGFIEDIYHVLSKVFAANRQRHFFIVAVGTRINSLIGKGSFIDTRCSLSLSDHRFNIFSVSTRDR